MTKRLFVVIPCAVIVAALAAGCGGSSVRSVPTDAVAVVGNDTISKADFNFWFNSAKSAYKARKQAFPAAGTTQYKSIQDQVVTYLVEQDELQQRGKDLGITVTKADVTKRLAQIKVQYFGGSDKKYRQQLAAQGASEKQVELQIAAQLLSEKIYNKVTASVKVSDSTVKAYYNAHKSQYQTTATRTVRHILVNSKSLAEQLEAKLKGGASFAALAKKYSKDPGSATQGGKLTISKGQTVPQFDKVAFSLKTGQTSPPVHTQYGWHIIQALSAIKPATVTPESTAAIGIKAQLLQTKKTSTIDNFVSQLKKDFAKKTVYQTGYQPASTTTSATATSTT